MPPAKKDKAFRGSKAPSGATKAVKATSESSVALSRSQQQEQDDTTKPTEPKLFRVPALVRQSVASLADVDSIPYYVPKAPKSDDPSPDFRQAPVPIEALPAHVAIRCRAAFDHPTAMYKNERGYVRALMHRAAQIVFYKAVGKFPILIFSGLSAKAIPLEVSATLQGASLRRTITVSYQPMATIEIPNEAGTDERELFVMFAANDVMTAVENHCHTLQTGSDPATRSDQGKTWKRWFSFAKRGSAETSAITLTKPGETAPAPTPGAEAPPANFDEIRFRYKRTYIKNCASATACLTAKEAAHLRNTFSVMIMPVRAIETHDESTEACFLTLRWKEETTHAVVSNICAAMQRKLNAFSYPITYGNVRVRLPDKVTRDTLELMRRELGDKVMALADIPPPFQRGAAWKAKKTLFVPRTSADESDTPSDTPDLPTATPATHVRRIVQLSAAVNWRQILAVANHLRGELIDCTDEFTLGPMSFVVEWKKEQDEWVKSLGTLAFVLGGRTVTVTVVPPATRKV